MPSNSNSINPKTLTHSPSPIYGIPYGFNISDLPSVGLAQPIPTLAAVSTATVSAELNIQARSIEIDVAFSAPLATCQIDVYSAADGYTQSLFTATASQVEKPATGTNLDPLPPDNTDNLLPSTPSPPLPSKAFSLSF